MPDSQTRALSEKLQRLRGENVRAQAVVDTLNELGFAYYRSDPEQGIECAREARDLAAALDYPTGMARSYKIEGVSLVTRGQHAEGKQAFEKCIEMARAAGSWNELASGHMNLGILYRNLGALDTALACHLESLSLYEEAGHEPGQAGSFINIGNIYANTGEHAKALDYQARALAIFEKLGDRHRIAIALRNLSAAHQRLGDVEGALEHCERSLALNVELDNPLGTASAYEQLGTLHEEAGEVDVALEKFNASLRVCETIGYRSLLAVVLLAIGRCERELGQGESALGHLQRGVELANELEQQSLQASGYREMSELFAQQGRYEKAYSYQKLFHELETEVSSEDTAREIARVELAHEIETKEKEAELQRLRTEALEQEIDERKRVEAALRESEDRFRRLSTEDALTGVFNRRYFLDLGTRLASRAESGTAGICVGLLDLDHFKRINDEFGHEAGDDVLKEFARVASRCVRPGDVFARYGGEEFAILFRECALVDGLEVMSRINAELKRAGVAWHGRVIPVSASGGIAHSDELRASGDPLTDLLRLADTRMYAAKAAGRSQIIAA